MKMGPALAFFVVLGNRFSQAPVVTVSKPLNWSFAYFQKVGCVFRATSAGCIGGSERDWLSAAQRGSSPSEASFRHLGEYLIPSSE